MKYLLHLLISLGFVTGFTNAQILPDFILEQPGEISGWAIDSENNFHFIGRTSLQDDNLYYVKYNANGDLIVPQTIISPEFVWQPDIGIIGNHALVCYTSLEQQIWGQIIDLTKEFPKPQEFQICDSNLVTSSFDPLVTPLNDTVFIVAWTGAIADSVSIYAQLVTISSNKIGENFFLNDNTGYQSFLSTIKVFPSRDRFLVIWDHNHPGNRLPYGRIFMADGVPFGAGFPIAEQTDIDFIYNSSAVIAPNGDFAVVWGGRKPSGWQVQWRWFNSDGVPLGNSITVADQNISELSLTAVTIDKDGKGVIFWSKQFQNIYNEDVYKLYGQRFTPAREFIGNPFKVTIDLDPHSEFIKGFDLSNNIITSIWRTITDEMIYFPHSRISMDKFNKIDFYSPPTLLDTVLMDINLENSGIVNNFELKQNYPNPFNPSTSISFNLPYEGMVTLKVFDILGNEIATLVNEVKPAGEYEIEFDASSLSSGIYIYTIQVNSSKGGFLDSKKMIVLK